MEDFVNCKFSLLSLNVRGMRKHRSRRGNLNWLSKHGGHSGICFLQETHSSLDDENSWKNQWRGNMYFSHGTKLSCGVTTFIGKDVEFSLKENIVHESGRFVILYCSIQRNDFVLVNIYAPNTEPEQVLFLKHVANTLKSLNYESTANIVVGGDFNCCMTDFDTDGGNYKPKKKSISFKWNLFWMNLI